MRKLHAGIEEYIDQSLHCLLSSNYEVALRNMSACYADGLCALLTLVRDVVLKLVGAKDEIDYTSHTPVSRGCTERGGRPIGLCSYRLTRPECRSVPEQRVGSGVGGCA